MLLSRRVERADCAAVAACGAADRLFAPVPGGAAPDLTGRAADLALLSALYGQTVSVCCDGVTRAAGGAGVSLMERHRRARVAFPCGDATRVGRA